MSGEALALQTRREVRCIGLEAIAATGRFVSGAYFFRGRTAVSPASMSVNTTGFTKAFVIASLRVASATGVSRRPKPVANSTLAVFLACHCTPQTDQVLAGKSPIPQAAVLTPAFASSGGWMVSRVRRAVRSTCCPETLPLFGSASRRQYAALTDAV